MGAFFLHKHANERPDKAIIDRAAAYFRQAGHANVATLTGDRFTLLKYGKRVAGTISLYEKAGDFCTSTGTLLYKGKIGEKGLRDFFVDYKRSAIDWSELFGHFCIILHVDGELVLFTDRIGLFHTWQDVDGNFFSSSFLALLTITSSATADTQAVYEYVFQGATYGRRSPVQEIKLVDCAHVHRLLPTTEVFNLEGRDPKPITSKPRDYVKANLENLRPFFRAIGRGFGHKVDAGLSGGYDSRLMLALLLEANVEPRLHVYGRDVDADVRVAKQIALGEGVEVQHVDKATFPIVDVEAYEEVVAANAMAFDGFPSDGIFDGGADLRTRMDRASQDYVMLNGGGGEIFRNFFYLPNSSYTIRDVLWTFYSQFDSATCSSVFDQEAYFHNLSRSLSQAIGTDVELLSREEVELVYPLFRCRFWMGKNNSINNKFGWALTPFIDPKVIMQAAATPIRMKSSGRLEAEMISRVSKRLAGYKSSYGRSFSGHVSMRQSISYLASISRPPRLRKVMFKVKALRREERPYYLTNQYLRCSLNIKLPLMRNYFRPENIKRVAQYNRLCTLEYLFQKFGVTV